MFFDIEYQFLFWNIVQILSEGSWKKNSGRFPSGVWKEGIQQSRQAQSLPGEKETLNIMLMEKGNVPKVGLDEFSVQTLWKL